MIHGVSPSLEAETWAGIWADIVAVNELCVRHGKQGSSPVSGVPKIFQCPAQPIFLYH